MERTDAHFVECGNLTTELSYRSEGQGNLLSKTYTEYFVGINPYTGNQIVANGKDDSTIDTTWGTSGYWDASPNLGPEYCMHQLADGRLLVSHNYYKVSMINTDGTTDTTWATNGIYTTPVGSEMTVYAILEDNDGNFHLFGGVAGLTSMFDYVKISSTGTYIGGLTRADTKLWNIYGAVWSDETKTRIIAAGQGVDVLGGLYPNIVAINPSTIAVDTTWTGNIAGNSGYAQYNPGAGNQLAIYHIYGTSDGGFILYRNTSKLLAKILSDGSALDTSWGTNGELDFSSVSFPYIQGHNPTQDGDEFYVIAVVSDGGSKNRFSRVDASGMIIDTFTVTNTPDGGLTTYYSVTLFNEQLLFGHQQYVELWNKDFTYVSRFSVANTNIVWWVLPDEVTALSVYEETESKEERWLVTTDANLIGETVSILADGVVMADQVVDDNGHITLYENYGTVHWGLAYESKLKPMKPVSQPDMMKAIVTCKQMGISVHNTDDIEYGVRDGDMKAINFDDVQWKNKCEIDGLFTGTVAVSVPDGFNVNLPLQIVTSAPLPATIRALIPRVDQTGD